MLAKSSRSRNFPWVAGEKELLDCFQVSEMCHLLSLFIASTQIVALLFSSKYPREVKRKGGLSFTIYDQFYDNFIIL